MYSPVFSPAASVSGRVRSRFLAEMTASCWTMSKKLSSFLPESCQHWETEQVRIWLSVQLLWGASGAGVMVTGDLASAVAGLPGAVAGVLAGGVAVDAWLASQPMVKRSDAARVQVAMPRV